MQFAETKGLKALEEKSQQLKPLVADQALNLQVVKDLQGKSGDARAAANGRRAPEAFRRPFRATGVPVHPIRARIPALRFEEGRWGLGRACKVWRCCDRA